MVYSHVRLTAPPPTRCDNYAPTPVFARARPLANFKSKLSGLTFRIRFDINQNRAALSDPSRYHHVCYRRENFSLYQPLQRPRAVLRAVSLLSEDGKRRIRNRKSDLLVQKSL